jgi:hypothetical protein
VEAPAANGELSLQKLRSLWQNLRTRAEEARPSLTAPLSRATLEALDGTTLVIRVPVPPMAEVVKRELSTLTRAIGEVTSHALTVRVVSGNAAPAPVPEPARPAAGGETANGAEAGLLDYALKTLPSSP